MELTQRSATDLARAIREGRTTSREVVEAHLALLEQVNPRLNAVVVVRATAARAEADAADARLAAGGGDPPPFLGVPCTVKESLALAGMPNAAGVVARRGHRAAETAPVVQRVLDAGAIPLGMTNTSEMCMWIETENRVYGRTGNAYDPSRTAGGSSGGEGAAVGSGISPFGLGSDLSGSIRVPAFCNGVFGHKPSLGLVPTTGSWPPCHGATGRLMVNGPIARRAEDLMPLLRVIAGPDGRDAVARDMPLGDPADVDLAGLRVVVADGAFLGPVARELLDARERAAAALRARGATVERRALRDLRRALEVFLTVLGNEVGVTSAEILAEAGAEAVSLRGMLRRGGPHTVATRLMLAAERVAARAPAGRIRRVLAAQHAVGTELAAAIEDGVLLHPPLPRVAPRHGRTVGRPWWLATMAPFNLAGLPVTQVPLGLGRAGLPLGVQVVAGPGRDHASIAVALELERAFGGWVPPDRRAAARGRRRPRAAAAAAPERVLSRRARTPSPRAAS